MGCHMWLLWRFLKSENINVRIASAWTSLCYKIDKIMNCILGSVGSSVFFFFTHKQTKSQDILASAALNYTILIKICHSGISQRHGSENWWSAPLNIVTTINIKMMSRTVRLCVFPMKTQFKHKYGD